MILRNLTCIEHHHKVSIEISDDKIAKILTGDTTAEIGPSFVFEDALVFPGLINSHDHLDFNLFPQLGEQFYSNYTEWGKQIHQTYITEIAEILQIPKALRELWGIYKNLICGVTTVVNHGPKMQTGEKWINVLENHQSLHSVKFEKFWKIKLNNIFKIHKNVVIHVGEGIDLAAKQEVDLLIKWNLINRPLIGIHGVVFSTQQAMGFKALIWCPQSNYYLLNQTVELTIIKQHIPILFGTDSTLTSSWNIWDHLNFARSLKMLTDDELYGTLSTNPARIWKQQCGVLADGQVADIVIAKRKNNPDGMGAFFDTQPCDLLLVMGKGKILLFDESVQTQMNRQSMKNYQQIKIGNAVKYVIGNIAQLISEIKKCCPSVQFPVEPIF